MAVAGLEQSSPEALHVGPRWVITVQRTEIGSGFRILKQDGCMNTQASCFAKPRACILTTESNTLYLFLTKLAGSQTRVVFREEPIKPHWVGV